MNRVNVSTTISLATRRQIDRLVEDYGTISEVITRAVVLLAAYTSKQGLLELDDYDRPQRLELRTAELSPPADLDPATVEAGRQVLQALDDANRAARLLGL